MAYINIYNIMNGIEKLFIDNKESIQQVIYDFHGEKTERYLHLYKGMMPTLPQDSFPSLEMEPGTMQNSWLTTECEYNTYTINFTLTTNEQNNRRGVNYISTLSRKLVEI